MFDFNEEVIRESILNAIAHRDYKISSEIVIKQYPSKIVLSNPGGFPKGVTLDNIIIVNSTPRSRLMTEILEKTGLVERSGQGIDKIYAYTLAEGKGIPDYTKSDYFQVVLNLSSIIEDSAFHMLIRPFYRDGILTLGVDEILTLYHIKTGHHEAFNRNIIDNLKTKGLLDIDNQGRLTLPPHYHAYKRIDSQKVGTYQVSDIRSFIIALGNAEAKSIGSISKQYQEIPNRNQLKYLIAKLISDGIIVSSGKRKGTKYQLNERFKEIQDINNLTDAVTRVLKSIYQ